MDKREAIKTAFNADPATHPVRILLATDAAREGLTRRGRGGGLQPYARDAEAIWNQISPQEREQAMNALLQGARTSIEKATF